MLQRLLRYPSTISLFNKSDEDDSTTTVGGESVYSAAPSPIISPRSGCDKHCDNLPFDMAYYLEEGLAREVRLDLTMPLSKGDDYHNFKVVRTNTSSFVLESEDTGEFLAYCHVDILKYGTDNIPPLPSDEDYEDDNVNEASRGHRQLGQTRRRTVRAKFYYYNKDDTLFSIDKPTLVMISSNDASEWTLLSSQCDGCRYRCKSGGTCSDILTTSDIINRSSLPLLDNPIKYYTIDDNNNDNAVTLSSSLLKKSPTLVNGIRLSSQQLCYISQDKKYVGRYGLYNSIKLAIPHVNDPIWCPLMGDNKKLPLRRSGGLSSNSILLSSNEPEWNNHTNCLILDFNNRIIIPSAKNFQLSLTDSNTICCQFGKIGNDTYALDVKYPLSVMQAFSAAISTILWN